MRLKLLILPLFLVPAAVVAQGDVSRQVWGNAILGWPQNKHLYLELDIEPKIQFSGGSQWHNADATPLLEYYPNSWLDLTAEMVLGRTRQTNDLVTFEASPRLGVRFHLLKNLWDYMNTAERIPLSRMALSTLIRYELRNLWYSRELPSDHQSRLRYRLESKIAVNRSSLDADKTVYLFVDAEAYGNIGKDIQEVFSSKFRLRLGPGYRASYRQRFEVLLLYDFARNTIDEAASRDAVAVDFRVKLFL